MGNRGGDGVGDDAEGQGQGQGQGEEEQEVEEFHSALDIRGEDDIVEERDSAELDNCNEVVRNGQVTPERAKTELRSEMSAFVRELLEDEKRAMEEVLRRADMIV